ncbi:MAG: molecular chaperone Tir [Candidatus Cloacimonas sp. SDB]|nr:MAG: molecular chaperone Tir [Candidatus Cloacimonas sp. SDB]
MKYQVYKLGNLKGGEIVNVVLSGNAANVKLMNSSNFNNYKNGRRHTYYGGYAKKSPVKIPVPSSGQWFVTIDLGGYSGTIKSSVNVLPGKLPNIKQAPLSTIPSLRLDKDYIDGRFIDKEDNREFDVFISHASEDKDDVVRPLAIKLRSLGLKVWFDEFELKIGDSLRRKIDKGLSRSRFGIVILSNVFINKGWTNYELDGIITKSISGQQIILPIWHNITKQQVIDYSPSLADKLARNTAVHTIDEIAEEIHSVVVQ